MNKKEQKPEKRIHTVFLYRKLMVMMIQYRCSMTKKNVRNAKKELPPAFLAA